MHELMIHAGELWPVWLCLGVFAACMLLEAWAKRQRRLEAGRDV